MQLALYVIQMLEVLFLCRRLKTPKTLLVLIAYIAIAVTLLNSRKYAISKSAYYCVAFGIALHYIMLMTVSLYILVWITFNQCYADVIYKAQIFVILISVGIAAYGYINGMSVRTNFYNVKSEKVSESIRVVHLSDLHITNMFNAKEVRDMVTDVCNLEPDVVCITGDIFDSRSSINIDLDSVYNELRRMRPKYGVYVSYGNHDSYLIDDLKELCDNTGFTLLMDESVTVGDLEIVGRKCSVNAAELEVIIKDRDKFSIVMDHIPNRIQESSDMDVDMHLSGHTHGGQLPPITHKFEEAYGVCTGTMLYDNTFVSISKGTYLIYPYCRLTGESEIICIDINKD